ncbi:hypothetical protein NL676_006633 [Syzygium grande]|nr:hypothetical protein NL676_006633 [Syzygium grande]
MVQNAMSMPNVEFKLKKNTSRRLGVERRDPPRPACPTSKHGRAGDVGPEGRVVDGVEESVEVGQIVRAASAEGDRW